MASRLGGTFKNQSILLMSGGLSLVFLLLSVHVCKSHIDEVCCYFRYLQCNNCFLYVSSSPFSVHLPLTKIIAVFSEDLARMYAKRDLLGLMKAVSLNAFVKRVRLVPSSFYAAIKEVEVIV